MYTNYNIPQKCCSKPQTYNNFTNSHMYSHSTYQPTNSYQTTSSYYNDGDRFIGGGFLGPLLLGGVGGYLLGRPNYGPNYGPGPIPVYFPPSPPPYPVPYSNTNIYY